MVRKKNFEALIRFGGVQGLVVDLGTDIKNGITGSTKADLTHRKNVFGADKYQKPPAKGFISYVFEACKDTTIIVLLACAILSLALGVKQHRWKDGWYDSGRILVAAILVVISTVSNFKQSKRFEKLSSKSSDIRVEVVRDSRWVVLGWAFLEGTKVMDGFGFMLVTSVGMNIVWGEMMSLIVCDMDEQTLLQARLNKITSFIGKGTPKMKRETRNSCPRNAVLSQLVTLSTSPTSPKPSHSRTLPRPYPSVVAAYRIILCSFSLNVSCMMVDHALVRKLSACETMGLATTICTDKTGTLTLNEMTVLEKLEDSGLTLLGLVGFKDPCRPGVRTAVESCKAAGKGKFKNYSLEERIEKIDKIYVMARSFPFYKFFMVQSLKDKGHIVAVTGDDTNDAPALREANIRLSMGIQGTEVAKESSDIVILDDNFTSVVTVLRWGRCVYNNIQKFIQFQLTINVASLVINFVAAVSSSKVPLTTIQLLWVNLIMDTLAALALATKKPINDIMVRHHGGQSEPFITRVMWRNLLAQALYQIIVLLILQFKGRYIFGVDEKVKKTLNFNIFVLC
uniref:Cation-transporting P-type ATPase N-terminal domain-containing protein n=1 Tax=Fagus sylvatica TaxID=28930 RepID=A0A2N9HXJ4_FAGSY